MLRAMSKKAPNPSPFMRQVRDAIRVRHYSIRTEEAYLDWAKRFIYPSYPSSAWARPPPKLCFAWRWLGKQSFRDQVPKRSLGTSGKNEVHPEICARCPGSTRGFPSRPAAVGLAAVLQHEGTGLVTQPDGLGPVPAAWLDGFADDHRIWTRTG